MKEKYTTDFRQFHHAMRKHMPNFVCSCVRGKPHNASQAQYEVGQNIQLLKQSSQKIREMVALDCLISPWIPCFRNLDKNDVINWVTKAEQSKKCQELVQSTISLTEVLTKITGDAIAKTKMNTENKLSIMTLHLVLEYNDICKKRNRL